MWAKVVWVEGNREMEDTIPLCWVIDDCVYWPPASAAKKTVQHLMDSKQSPDENWRQYPVKKIKFQSGRPWCSF